MFEKVSPQHPDKIADQIAGCIVDLAYAKAHKQGLPDPRIAVEVLIGHRTCAVITETSISIPEEEIRYHVRRICEADVSVTIIEVPQDKHLADNQLGKIRCGDNGIFKGMPVTDEQKRLTGIAHDIYDEFETDGKYILDGERLVICQSFPSWYTGGEWLRKHFPDAVINPIGDWTGGIDVDAGATNRKLGSDMGDSVTGGGLHGKDFSKADVSVNIYAWLKAQETGQPVEISCAIGDEIVDGRPYSEIVKIAKDYIEGIGGFEKFAEWGLIR